MLLLLLFGIMVKNKLSAKNNFKNELEKLYKKYSPMVLRRCHFLVRDIDQARDAMQETFAGILKQKLNCNNTNLSSYIYKAATNTCLNIIKKQKKADFTDNDLVPEIPVHDNHEKMLMANMTLEKIFKTEKITTKQIAILYYVYDLNLTQTANLVGMSVSGLRKRLKKLKEKCQHYQMN